jgi:type I restriction enzyme M protein
MVGLAAPHGVAYDPCLGTGRLLAQAVQAADGEHGVTQAAGQEIGPEQALIAQLYFIISGADIAVEVGDVFSHDAYPDLAADCIVADPPLGVIMRPETIDRDDPRWLYGDPVPSDAPSAWIQHVIYHLAPGGRAVILVPNSALGGGGRGRVLQRIIRADLVDAVVSLPSGTLDSTRIPTALLVLQRDRSNGVRQGTPGPVLMIDIQQEVQDHRKVSPLEEATVNAVIDQYGAWSKKADLPADPSRSVVVYNELAANDFNLDPRRYTMRPAPDIAPDDLEQERRALEVELMSLLEECRVVDDALRDSLAGGRS